jgi:hypothetical protein
VSNGSGRRFNSEFAAKEMDHMTQISQSLGSAVKVPLGPSCQVKPFMSEGYLHVWPIPAIKFNRPGNQKKPMLIMRLQRRNIALTEQDPRADNLHEYYVMSNFSTLRIPF